jgi:hypothetical protein
MEISHLAQVGWDAIGFGSINGGFNHTWLQAMLRMRKNRFGKTYWSGSVFLFLVLAAGCTDSTHGYTPRVGDILFQSLPHNRLVDAIEGSTDAPFSHCGILMQRDGKFVVLEAIGPVKETPLGDWIDRGRFGGFATFRFKEKYQTRVDEGIREAEKYLGRRYDVHYSFDNDEIYCSELVFVAFKKVFGEDLGRVRKLGDLNWGPYVDVIFEIEGGLPKTREMITPEDLSEAGQLEQIFRYNI